MTDRNRPDIHGRQAGRAREQTCMRLVLVGTYIEGLGQAVLCPHPPPHAGLRRGIHVTGYLLPYRRCPRRVKKGPGQAAPPAQPCPVLYVCPGALPPTARVHRTTASPSRPLHCIVRLLSLPSAEAQTHPGSCLCLSLVSCLSDLVVVGVILLERWWYGSVLSRSR